MKFKRRKKIGPLQRVWEWLCDQWEEIRLSVIAALVLVLLIIMLVLSKQARADEPQVVNRDGKVTCGCALGGAEGACAKTESWVKLRDLKLRSDLCGKKLELAKGQAEAHEKAALGFKAALALSQSSMTELQTALEARRRQVDALNAAIDAMRSPSHSRVLWGIIGVAVGVAATIGVGYALRPAR